jgi:hypothetical protein
MSTSQPASDGAPTDGFPVETDIYILPDGQIVIADLPLELAGLADSPDHLGDAAGTTLDPA